MHCISISINQDNNIMTDSSQEQLLEQWPHRCADSNDSPLFASEKAVRRDTLLEHWPKRKSSMSVTSFDSVEDEATSAKRNRRPIRSVHFSESSRLYVYERESKYFLRSLTYNKDQRNIFGKEALLEGLRIKRLVGAAPFDSTAESIRYLLNNGAISKEELIGIEHYIVGHPNRVPMIRQRHSKAVLQKQRENQHKQLEDAALSLSMFAKSSSLKSMQRARIRAAMAA